MTGRSSSMSDTGTIRVLYLIDSLVPGGAERSLAATAPYLERNGVRLEVAYLHDRPGLQDELLASGVMLHLLAGPGGRPGVGARPSGGRWTAMHDDGAIATRRGLGHSSRCSAR